MFPSVSSGYFIDNQGGISITFSQNSSPIVNQNLSVLRTSIMSNEVIGKIFQAQKQEAQFKIYIAQQKVSWKVYLQVHALQQIKFGI